MENFSEFVGGLTSKLAKGLKLVPTEQGRLAQFKATFLQNRAENQDSLEALKDEIHQVEDLIKLKKARYDAAHGLVQKTIGQEIEQAFRELDRKESQGALILRNLETTSVTLDKIRELEEAGKGGVDEQHLDEIAVRLEDAFAEVKQADAALEGLTEVKYEARARETMDLDRRLGELSGSKGPKKSEPGLSDATLERLKKLEKETD